jgi:peptide/nickel transport system substrate-binding protein/oligopeptide transport system substrate-binding protein
MKARDYQKLSEAGSVQKLVLWRDAVVRYLLAETWGLDRVMTTARRAIAKLPLTWRPSRRFSVLSLLVVVAFAISACNEQHEPKGSREASSQVAQVPAIGGTYRRPLGQDPSSLDPVKLVDLYGVAVANQIFDGLVTFDAHLNVVPALAQSWSASRDGLVWTFHLRKDVQFHNGREMSAEDVVYSLSRLLDPAVGSLSSVLLDKVQGAAEFQAGTTKVLEGIRAVDRYTVEVSLSEPFVPFISILGMPHTSIVPRDEVEGLGPDFGTAPVGTGPFRFARWVRGQEILLEANKHYFGGRPALDGVRFVIFPGSPQRVMLKAFEQGELEESPLTPDRRREFLEAATYKVVRKPTLSLRLYGFNLERPPFRKREVRQAFNYALDKTHLNQEVYGGLYVVARGILPPGMPGYSPEVQGYDYDPAKAKKLLAEAGHPGGKNLTPVTLLTAAKSAEVRAETRIIQHSLAALDVQVDVQEASDWPTFRVALEQGDVQLFRYSWYADYPDPDYFLYPLFHSAGQRNYYRYHNPLVDKLLDAARRETDDLQRVDLYRQAEQLILNDAPAVMLMHLTYESVFQPYVKGVVVSALGEAYVSLRKVWLTQTGKTRGRK